MPECFTNPALFTAILQAATAMIKTMDLQQFIVRLKTESEAAKALMIEYGLMPGLSEGTAPSRPHDTRRPVRRAGRRAAASAAQA